MAGSTATRLWRVYKEANLPFPTLDTDDVIQFQIMETIALKVNKEDQEAHKEAERKDWKHDPEGLDALRDII